MKFIDLQAQYQQYKDNIDSAIHSVLEHGQFIKGPEVSRLETALADYVGVRHCIGCASGTTALQVALMALDIGPGDEVITSAFSFFATAEVILLLGAKPVYVDVESKTYNMNPLLLESAITSKTKAILPVNLYGQPADFDAINKVALTYNLPVVEDAAQSLGAEYKSRCSGSLSMVACTSFFPSKPLGCYGDGGACFTDNNDLAAKMRMIADHGQSARYEHQVLGVNGRLDTLQAAILLEKLRYLSKEIGQRQAVAEAYSYYLRDDARLVLPFVEAHNQSAYAQYTIQVESRDRIQKKLAAEKIPTAVHYPKGLHQQLVSAVDQKVCCPVTEALALHVLSLPFYPLMTVEMVKTVATKVKALLA